MMRKTTYACMMALMCVASGQLRPVIDGDVRDLPDGSPFPKLDRIPMSSRDSCDASKLQGLNATVREAIDAAKITGKIKPLLPMLGKVPSSCLRLLANTTITSGDCASVEETAMAVCAAGDNRDVLQAMLLCTSQPERCQLLDTVSEQCLKLGNVRHVAAAMGKLRCQTTSLHILLNLPKEILERRLTLMSHEAFLSLLVDMGLHARLLAAMPCDGIAQVMSALEGKVRPNDDTNHFSGSGSGFWSGSGSGWWQDFGISGSGSGGGSHTDAGMVDDVDIMGLIPLLPYLPEKACIDMGENLVGRALMARMNISHLVSLLRISELPFHCGHDQEQRGRSADVVMREIMEAEDRLKGVITPRGEVDDEDWQPGGDLGPSTSVGDGGPILPERDRGPILPVEDRGPILPVGDRGPILPDRDRGPILPDGDMGPILPHGDRGPVLPDGDRGPTLPDRDRKPTLPDSTQGGRLQGITAGRYIGTGTDTLEKLLAANAQNSRCNFTCGKVLMRLFTEMAMALSLELGIQNTRERLGTLVKCLPARELVAAAAPGQCGDIDISFIDDNARLMRELASKCQPEKQMNELTKADILNMGCSVVFLPPQELFQIRSEAICGALNRLSGCLRSGRVSRDVLGWIASECSRDSSSPMDAQKAKMLGGALLHMPRDKLVEMDKQVLQEPEVLAQIAEEMKVMQKQRHPQTAAMGFTLARKMDLANIIRIKEVVGSIGRRDFLKKLEGDDGRVTASSVMANMNMEDVDPDLSEAQNREVFNVLMNSDDLEGQKNTAAVIRMAKSTVMGMSLAQMSQMPPGDHLGIVTDMCRYKGFKGKQLDGLKELARSGLFDLNPRKPYAELTADMVNDMDEACLLKLNAMDMTDMNNAACRAVCAKFGSAKRLSCETIRVQRQGILNVCVACLGMRGGRGQLSADDVSLLGKLLAHANATLIDSITDQALKTQVKKIGFQCLDKSVGERIQERLSSLIRGMESDEEVAALGPMGLISASRALFHRSFVRLANNLDAIREGVELADDDEREEITCCTQERTSNGEHAAADDRLHQYEMRVKQVVMDTADTASGRRRRRTVASELTCTDLKMMGDAVTSISVSDIHALDDDEVLPCLSFVGSMSSWSVEQRDTWLAKAKMIVGQTCNIPADTLKHLAWIGLSFQPFEIGCLRLDDTATASFGSVPGWSEEQMRAFVANYRLTNEIAPSEKLTADQLVTIGHLIWGLYPDDIAEIPPSVFQSASVQIGALKKAPLDQLQAMTSLAVRVFGDPTSWTASLYTELGILLGGMDGVDLARVNPDVIEGWDTDGIRHITPDNLKHLSVGQLMSFSKEQLQSIHPDAYRALDATQMNQVAAGIGNPQSRVPELVPDPGQEPNQPPDNPVNDARAVQCSIVTVCVAFLAALL